MGQQTQFTPREREISALLLQGKSNKQIALALGISVRTVEFHLSNIYAKLGATSRTEAALKLTESGLRESTGGELRESTVVETGKAAENGGKSFSQRRFLMKRPLLIGFGLLIVIAVLCVGAFFLFAPVRTETFAEIATVADAPIQIDTPTDISTLTVSPQEQILAQIRQLAAEYDQAVQAEKKTGKVEFSQDPNTGEEVFFFKDESYVKMDELFSQFMLEKTKLEDLYTQIYRAELQPTPFPTQSSPDQDHAFYDTLEAQSEAYCSLEAWQKDPQAQSLLAYDPSEGKYRPIYYGDVIARCNLHGQMLQEFRDAPWLPKVNHEANMATIRAAMGNPDLRLTFRAVDGLANANRIKFAFYRDESGTEYAIGIEPPILAGITPNFPTHPQIPAEQTKSVDELRAIASQFALAHSPRLTELKSTLLYEEGHKGDIYFFRWDYRNRDWGGTDWAMMPPLLQVGLLADGRVVIYLDTLDFYQ